MGKYTTNSCYIIAEIGVNHNGDLDLAKKMIDEAKAAGADAVKFQTFKAEALVTIGTPKVEYQKKLTAYDESHYEMIKKLELSQEHHKILYKYCVDSAIDFMTTPYDPASVDFLETLNVEQYKIASADLVDLKLLQAVAKTYKPVILSVGMANLGEIEQALQIFNEYAPEDIVLLHCVSNYPCADKSLNLNVMKTLEAAFPHPVGYSDHSVGNLAAVISIVLGAKVIEKHFTLDKSLSGPDHAASTTPAEFRDLVEAIRRAEIMLGSGKKTCQVEEEQMSLVSRKSITLAKDMCKGEVISENDLVMMRPGTGLRANSIQDIVGKCLRKDMGAYSLLDWTDIDECS